MPRGSKRARNQMRPASVILNLACRLARKRKLRRPLRCPLSRTHGPTFRSVSRGRTSRSRLKGVPTEGHRSKVEIFSCFVLPGACRLRAYRRGRISSRGDAHRSIGSRATAVGVVAPVWHLGTKPQPSRRGRKARHLGRNGGGARTIHLASAAPGRAEGCGVAQSG